MRGSPTSGLQPTWVFFSEIDLGAPAPDRSDSVARVPRNSARALHNLASLGKSGIGLCPECLQEVADMEARRQETEVVEPGRREPAVAAVPTATGENLGTRDVMFGLGTLGVIVLAAIVTAIILTIT